MSCRRLLAALFLAFFLGSSSWAQSFELVESFPEGTDFHKGYQSTQEAWLKLIDGAEGEIRWATFYVTHEPGKSTGPVLEALKRAAARGVKVKLLVDGKFLNTYPEPLGSLGKIENIEVRTSPVGRWFGGVMHAKMLLVDKDRGFLGSQNFDWRSLQHIRELGLIFHDLDLADFYISHFDWEWEHHQDLNPPSSLPKFSNEAAFTGSRPTASPSALNREEEFSDEFQIVSLLNSAQESAVFALLSYSPTSHDGKTYYGALDQAVRAAAVRGVKVRIIVSHWMEEKDALQHLHSLDALENVEVRICRVPPAAEGEIPFARVHHSKYLVVDGDRCWLGTSNWDQGYFHESRNYGLVVEATRIPPLIHQIFEHDWERSTALEKKSS